LRLLFYLTARNEIRTRICGGIRRDNLSVEFRNLSWMRRLANCPCQGERPCMGAIRWPNLSLSATFKNAILFSIAPFFLLKKARVNDDAPKIGGKEFR